MRERDHRGRQRRRTDPGYWFAVAMLYATTIGVGVFLVSEGGRRPTNPANLTEPAPTPTGEIVLSRQTKTASLNTAPDAAKSGQQERIIYITTSRYGDNQVEVTQSDTFK